MYQLPPPAPSFFVNETPRTLGLRPGPCWSNCPDTGRTVYHELRAPLARRDGLWEDQAGN